MGEQKNYCEYVYKPDRSLKLSLFKVLLITMYVLFAALYALIYWFVFPYIPLIVLLPFLMFVMIRLTWRLVSTEYEVMIEAGELKIAVIYGKAGRRTKFRYDIKEMSLIAPYDSEHNALFEGEDITQRKLFTRKEQDDKAYACICPDLKKSEKTLVVFMCTDEMKKLLRISHPSAFRS